MHRLSLIFLVITLTGCATCSPQTFNKSVPINPSKDFNFKAISSTNTLLKINDDVSIIIGNCLSWNDVLCAVVAPSPGTRVRFESNEFPEIDAVSGKKVKTHYANIIRYMVECYTKKNGERVCDSSEESPTGLLISSKQSQSEYKGNVSENILKTFDPSLEFVGASELKSALASSVLSMKGKREYVMPIILEIDLRSNPRIIQLPRIIVNGISYKLPDVQLTTVTGRVCHSSAW